MKEMERDTPEKKVRRSPPAARHCWREEEEQEGEANGYGGEETSPCPDITHGPVPQR